MNNRFASELVQVLEQHEPLQTDNSAEKPSDALLHLLSVIRKHLDMEVAFISELTEGRRFFRWVDSDPRETRIKMGASDPEKESYCYHVVNGNLPQLIQNAQELDAAKAITATESFPVGAHISVPIVLDSGRVYGTFCCFSKTPDYELDSRDQQVMHAFAEVVAKSVSKRLARQDELARLRTRVSDVIDNARFTPVYQPIIRMSTQEVVGYESLTRFQAKPERSPDRWFAEAGKAGLAQELEEATIRKALQNLSNIPGDRYVSFNVSPDVLVQMELAELFADIDPQRVVIELTEHDKVSCYESLEQTIQPWRERGLRLAVDDAGAGYSSFSHILALKPDIVKLDISIVRNINQDLHRQALAKGLVSFATTIGCRLIAEGVETKDELNCIRSLGINKAQGYLLGRPQPADQILI
jgi:EAL domain-containing protein (putative c-di-GMP-specific phosphodiesterase class I)